MHNIKVSIMIPAYNVETYIERCIQSAIDQTLHEIEIIVVNDGSTDTTQTIIERMAREDDRIIIVNKPNGGLPSARNASLDIARGEYIQTLDGDDWLEPTACEEMYQYAVEHDLDVVVVDYYLDDDHGNVHIEKSFMNVQGALSAKEALEKIFREPDSGMLCNKFIKRELYDDVRLPEHLSYGEDILTAVKVMTKSNRIGKHSRAFYHYIDNPSGISKRNVAKIMYQYFEVFEHIRGYLGEAKLLLDLEDALKILEHKKITSFMSHEPLVGDSGYIDGVHKVITYMKENKGIAKELSLPRKMFLWALSLSPTKTNLMRLSKWANFLRRLKG